MYDYGYYVLLPLLFFPIGANDLMIHAHWFGHKDCDDTHTHTCTMCVSHEKSVYIKTNKRNISVVLHLYSQFIRFEKRLHDERVRSLEFLMKPYKRNIHNRNKKQTHNVANNSFWKGIQLEPILYYCNDMLHMN